MPDGGTSAGDRRLGPPDPYLHEVAAHIRRLAVAGRGEDVRGRNLLALHVLETSYAHGWLSYAPHRDVGRWLVMLLDLVGARVGLPPEARLERTVGTFLDDLRDTGLRRIADVTDAAVLHGLSRRFAWPSLALAPVAPRLSMASVLWHVGFQSAAYRSQVHFEKHSQGKLIRRKIGTTLDERWAHAVHEQLGGAAPTALHVLAALPPAFSVVLDQVESALHRVDESLEGMPFAVFYALVTDAARSGRRWEPPDRFVEGWAYSREDFERAVGRSLKGAHSRKARYRRSVALAELGLSSYFPTTVAMVDGWLARGRCSELWVEAPDGVHAREESSWLELARGNMEAIEDLQWRIYASVTDGLDGRPVRRSQGGAS
ncbi:MAG: hypothetical protein P8Y02_13590 [Deinococcales bacterium]